MTTPDKTSLGPGLPLPLGNVVSTPGVIDLVTSGRATSLQVAAWITMHECGFWGEIDAHDKAVNDDAAANGGRVLSAYAIDPEQPCPGYGDNCVWIITERDRSVTTILLPDEY